MSLATDWAETPEQSIPENFFDPERDRYWMLDGKGDWMSLKEPSVRRALKLQLSSRAGPDEALSPLDQYLVETQFNKNLVYAGPLAGATKGPMVFQGRRVLVTDSPVIIQPVPGEWPVLTEIITNLLGDQAPYFYGWLKLAREALLSGRFLPGQLLVMAGPRDCGKSLVQGLITPLLGGRCAKPYGWMTGATDFNGDLFMAEHLMIEDEAASFDLRTRRTFAARIKEVTVNPVQRLHAKHRQAMTLAPMWRISLTVNDEPENLTILPPLDESLMDKIMLLRASKFPMPMPTVTTAERERFMSTLLGELPAFCAFLDSWDIPADLSSPRFGITHYHDPALIAAINSFAPEFRLLQLIDEVLMPGRREWQGTAEELERTLLANSSIVHETRRLLHYATACGTYLGRLSKKVPARVTNQRTADSRSWSIKASDEQLQAMAADAAEAEARAKATAEAWAAAGLPPETRPLKLEISNSPF